jgi:hypothetical protein
MWRWRVPGLLILMFGVVLRQAGAFAQNASKVTLPQGKLTTWNINRIVPAWLVCKSGKLAPTPLTVPLKFSAVAAKQ